MADGSQKLMQNVTFADLLADLPRHYEEPNTRRDYSYAIKKCAEAYGVGALDKLPLETVPVFERRFPRNGFTPTMPFKTDGSYRAWRKKVLAVLRKDAGLITRRGHEDKVDDDWAGLLTAAGPEADRLGLARQSLIPLGILVKEARKRNAPPQELSPTLLTQIVDDLAGARRQSLKKALRLLGRLRSSSADIDALLPPAAQLILLAQDCPAAHRHLLEEAERWVSEHCGGEYDELEEKYENGSSAETHKTYLAAFRTYLHTAAEIGLLDNIETLAETLSSEISRDVMRAWIRRVPGGDIKERSMVQYVRDLRRIAEGRGIDVSHISRYMNINGKFKAGKAAGKEMAERPKAFCRWLLSDRRATLEFMSLHIRFLKQAEELLEASHVRPLEVREREALRRFGTLAALAAIWLWIAPLRITNMLELTIHGARPKLHLPGRKRNYALLLIPGDETKTGRSIRKKVSPNRSRALEAIGFYLKHIRPRYPTAASSPYLFPGHENETTPLDGGTVRRLLKRSCQEVHFYPMSPHWFRHGIASLFLKHNPGAYTHAGRMLDDTAKTVRKFYGFIDDEQLLEEAQVEMLKIAGFGVEEPHTPSRITARR